MGKFLKKNISLILILTLFISINFIENSFAEEIVENVFDTSIPEIKKIDIIFNNKK
jgi:hypothetical protein